MPATFRSLRSTRPSPTSSNTRAWAWPCTSPARAGRSTASRWPRAGPRAFGSSGGRLPAPSLARPANDPLEPLRGVAPVGLHRALGGIRVSLVDGGDDRVVFGGGGPEIAHQQAEVKPLVTLCLGLDGGVEGKKPAAGAGLDVGPVKAAVEIVQPVEVGPAHVRLAAEVGVDGAE